MSDDTNLSQLTDEELCRLAQGPEGGAALDRLLELAERYQVEMPIVQTVNAIVNKGMSAAEAVKSLMERGLKNELPQSYEK